MQLKVCGLSDVNQIIQLDEVGIELVGFIFYKPSPRYILNFSNAENIKKIACKNAKKTGVFVHEKTTTILSLANQFGLDFIQLHGNESPEFCAKIKNHFPIIKAISVSDDSLNIQEELLLYNDVVDYFLFDTNTTKYGGSGKKFNWTILEKINVQKPYFLSGGIGLESIPEIQIYKQQNHPNFWGIDINSKFEKAPTIKKIDDIIHFKKNI